MLAVDTNFVSTLSVILWVTEWAGALVAIAGALVMSMNRRWSRHAWALWILSNLLLMVPIAHGGLWGLLAMQLAFLLVNVNGCLRYRRNSVPPPGRQRIACHRRERPRRVSDHTAADVEREAGNRNTRAAAAWRRCTSSRRSSPPPLCSQYPRRNTMLKDKHDNEIRVDLVGADDGDRRYYVYEVVDPRAPDTPLYVGKGVADRIYDHVTAARAYNKALAAGRRPQGGRFVRKHAKLLRQGHRLEVKKRATGLTHHAALAEEKRLIAEIGRIEEGGPLLNLSAGGDGVDPAITSSVEHRQRARNQIRRVNTNPALVKARIDRLDQLHADPAWHAAAVARLHRANRDPATRARIEAAAAAGRRALHADPVRRAKLVAACAEGQRRRLAQPAERAKHRAVMRKVHAQPDWRTNVIAGSRAAHADPRWRESFDRGMARRDADGLHGARTREGLRRKRDADPVFAAQASARGRAAMARLHADPVIKARHRAHLAALHKNPDLDAWRRKRHQWHFACRRAAKRGLPLPPPPQRDAVHPARDDAAGRIALPPIPTTGALPMKARTSLRTYSVSAARRPGQRSLAQLIKFNKKRLDVTYRQIAAAAGLSVATVWEMVHSVQVTPSLDTLHRVGFVLGFSLAEVAPPK